ncbi:hypothetical protein L249_7952, partial [Ophiocordyceps polyrhachis-furcata BCC 54312]
KNKPQARGGTCELFVERVPVRPRTRKRVPGSLQQRNCMHSPPLSSLAVCTVSVTRTPEHFGFETGKSRQQRRPRTTSYRTYFIVNILQEGPPPQRGSSDCLQKASVNFIVTPSASLPCVLHPISAAICISNKVSEPQRLQIIQSRASDTAGRKRGNMQNDKCWRLLEQQGEVDKRKGVLPSPLLQPSARLSSIQFPAEAPSFADHSSHLAPPFISIRQSLPVTNSAYRAHQPLAWPLSCVCD